MSGNWIFAEKAYVGQKVLINLDNVQSIETYKESASLAEIRFTNDTTIVVEHSLDYLKDALEAVNL